MFVYQRYSYVISAVNCLDGNERKGFRCIAHVAPGVGSWVLKWMMTRATPISGNHRSMKPNRS